MLLIYLCVCTCMYMFMGGHGISQGMSYCPDIRDKEKIKNLPTGGKKSIYLGRKIWEKYAKK